MGGWDRGVDGGEYLHNVIFRLIIMNMHRSCQKMYAEYCRPSNNK